MDKTARLDRTSTVDEEYMVAIDQYIVEMNRLAVQLAQGQRRIEKLQADTQAALQAVCAELDLA